MIYVVCPATIATGGTELCHQFVRALIDAGASAKILYVGRRSPLVAARFERYAVPHIVDAGIVQASDIVVVPETLTRMVFEFPKSKRFIWWMSVDNYLSSLSHPKWSKRLIWRIKRAVGLRKLFDFSDRSIGHLCQSRYVAEFVKERGVSDFLFLSDCLNEEFLAPSTDLSRAERADRVLYNPSKGFWFTRKIIDANPDIDFVAIEGMTPHQIKSLMRASKLYIDFGDHPGKDRLPREAAVCGCCIITGRDGSAAYHEDVPIPDKYKIDRADEALPHIAETIRATLINYDRCIGNFRHYVQKINQEPAVFAKQVMEFLSTVESTRARQRESVRSTEFQG
jgi:hypothetical protein